MLGDQRKRFSQEAAMTLLIVGLILLFGGDSGRISEPRSSRRDSVSARYGWKGCDCGGDRCGGLGGVRVLVARMVDWGEAAGVVHRRNGVQETLEVIGKPLTPVPHVSTVIT